MLIYKAYMKRIYEEWKSDGVSLEFGDTFLSRCGGGLKEKKRKCASVRPKWNECI